MLAVLAFLTLLEAGYKSCPIQGSMAFDYLQDIAEMRSDDVKHGFEWMWIQYRDKAWGADQIEPLTGKKDDTWGGLCLFMIESLGTMNLMGFKRWYNDVEDYILSNLDFDIDQDVNVYATTVKFLGGLLSAYDTHPTQQLAGKIKQIGAKVMSVYNFKNILPYSDLNLLTEKAENKYGALNIAEMYNALEILKLSEVAVEPEYRKASKRVENYMFNALIKQQNNTILGAQYIPSEEKFIGDFTIGARGDSFYEYIYKSYLLDGKKDKVKRKVWEITKQRIFETLIHRTNTTEAWMYLPTISWNNIPLNSMSNHACFFPGTLFLQQIVEGYNATEFAIGDDLLRTCIMQYTHFKGKWPADRMFIGRNNTFLYVHANINEYHLFPETIESIYYAWRLTHNEWYRDVAAYIYKNLWHIARGPYGFCSLKNVVSNPQKLNDQPTQVSSELLKYLYLIFEDEDRIDLNQQVFTTGGHLLNIIK